MKNIEQESKTNYLVIILAAVGTGLLIGIGFLAGVLFNIKENKQTSSSPQINSAPQNQVPDLKIKGNKNSRIYHLPSCPNYNDISERNIIWFKTHEEAKAKGFRMAQNCN